MNTTQQQNTHRAIAAIYGGLRQSYTLAEDGTILTWTNRRPQPTPEHLAGALAQIARKQMKPVKRLQLRLWLHDAGISVAAVETAIESLPPEKRDKARIYWESAAEYTREDMDDTGAALGFTPEQIDAAFVAASQL